LLTLLAPFALFGAALLAIPILIHLFKPRKVRQTPFSSLRWLHLTQQKLARRIKWHQVLLFLLRAAFILLLVFALAKPMFAPKGSTGLAERFIVLDVSRSMSYQPSGRESPIEVGKKIAADLVTHGMAGDRTTVLLTGSSTRALGPLARDPGVYLAALRGTQATASDTDLTSSLQVIRPMLAHRRPGTSGEIYFITDNHQQSWRQGEIAGFLKDLGANVKVKLIDVGVTAAQNAWIADAELIQIADPARRLVRVKVGCVGDAAQERTIKINGLPGLPELTAKVKIQPRGLAQVDLEIPAGYDISGKVAHVTLDPPDGLPSDDDFFVNLDARALVKVLLVEAESSQVQSLRPGLYLSKAIEALAKDGRSIQLTVKPHTEVQPADVAAADTVILAEVPELPEAVVAAIESRVKSGGGLAIFLGPDIQQGFYNTRLWKPALPSDSLMPMALKKSTELTGSLEPLTNIEWSNPLLAPLYDPVLGDLAQTKFRGYFQLEGEPKNSQVLAMIGSETPAIIEHALGLGRVILFNTTADDSWSDLPRRKSFVPLVDRLVTHLSGANLRRSYQVGDTVALPLTDMPEGAAVTVTNPAGKKITPLVRREGGRSVLRLDNLTDPGVYRVEHPTGSGTATFAFVVQTGRGDSVLTPTETDTLKKWWEPVALETVSPEMVGKLASAQSRYALWPWLIALGGLLLLAEMFFVHWLCPKVNPALAQSNVPRQGIFTVRTAEKVA
jgi:hypothetical protein